MAEYVTGQRERRRVAVVGSGVAGLTAAHVLGLGRSSRDPVRGRPPARRSRRHPRRRRRRTHRRRSTPASSSTTTAPTRRCCVCSPSSASRPSDSDMSMSVRVDDPAGGASSMPVRSARAACSRRCATLLDPAYLRMLTEVKRFHRHATEILASPVDAGGRRGDAAGVRGPGRLQRVLHHPLPRAAGRGRVVLRPRPRPATTRRATSSSSSTTTACSRSSGRPPGAPSSAGPRATSRRSRPVSTRSELGRAVTACRRDRRRRSG